MDDNSDLDLISLACRSDKAAFGALMVRREPMALRLALRLTGQEDIARDLVQEAFLQAYLSLDCLRQERSFTSWLYGIVLNVCRGYLREQRVNLYPLESLPGGLLLEALPLAGWSTFPDPYALAEEHELQAIIRAAVDLLPPQTHRATLLFYYEQLTIREVAAALEISPGAVKVHLHKARKSLRQQLVSRLPEMAAEEISVKKRRKTMVPVTIADVVIRERKVETQQPPPASAGEERPLMAPHQYRPFVLANVILWDQAGGRILPIWMGEWEARAIAMGLRDFPISRPMTYNFMANLLEAAGARLTEVRVATLKDNTYYAIARLLVDSQIREVDARPSDALALAVRTNAPIYVDAEILAKAGKSLPPEANIQALLGKGIDEILQELQSQTQDPAHAANTLAQAKAAYKEWEATILAPKS
ncbi:MAG: sigma-70 family RNA polymerase sigma factor [Chloroflexi bacterium]|nr:sigma-70 family RNA polymerase sigma factor [Chloroflexota bacterium]